GEGLLDIADELLACDQQIPVRLLRNDVMHRSTHVCFSFSNFLVWFWEIERRTSRYGSARLLCCYRSAGERMLADGLEARRGCGFRRLRDVRGSFLLRALTGARRQLDNDTVRLDRVSDLLPDRLGRSVGKELLAFVA